MRVMLIAREKEMVMVQHIFKDSWLKLVLSYVYKMLAKQKNARKHASAANVRT